MRTSSWSSPVTSPSPTFSKTTSPALGEIYYNDDILWFHDTSYDDILGHPPLLLTSSRAVITAFRLYFPLARPFSGALVSRSAFSCEPFVPLLLLQVTKQTTTALLPAIPEQTPKQWWRRCSSTSTRPSTRAYCTPLRHLHAQHRAHAHSSRNNTYVY